MGMTSPNIVVNPEGETTVENVLVMRLDNSPYLVSLPDEPGLSYYARSSEFYLAIPNLWGWIKLWWTLRPLRAAQDPDSLKAMIRLRSRR